MRHLKKYKLFESLVGEDLEYNLIMQILDTRTIEYSNAPKLKPISPNVIVGGKSYKIGDIIKVSVKTESILSCIDKWAYDDYKKCIVDVEKYKELKDGLFKWFEQTFGINPLIFIDKLQEISDEYEIPIHGILSDNITLYVDGKVDFYLSIPHRHDSLSSIESFFNDFSKTMGKEWRSQSIIYSDSAQTLETEIRLS